MQRDEYDRIKAHADACGESVNGFIKRAIKSQMASDAHEQPHSP